MSCRLEAKARVAFWPYCRATSLAALSLDNYRNGRGKRQVVTDPTGSRPLLCHVVWPCSRHGREVSWSVLLCRCGVALHG
jgi:hypothetical protein